MYNQLKVTLFLLCSMFLAATTQINAQEKKQMPVPVKKQVPAQAKQQFKVGALDFADFGLLLGLSENEVIKKVNLYIQPNTGLKGNEINYFLWDILRIDGNIKVRFENEKANTVRCKFTCPDRKKGVLPYQSLAELFPKISEYDGIVLRKGENTSEFGAEETFSITFNIKEMLVSGTVHLYDKDRVYKLDELQKNARPDSDELEEDSRPGSNVSAGGVYEKNYVICIFVCRRARTIWMRFKVRILKNKF